MNLVDSTFDYLVTVFNFLMTVFNFFATAVGITVLSKFYRHIIDGETGEGAAAVAP